MGSFSLWHWLVVILIFMLFFGRGKISDLMGDFAKGINSFKKGLAEGDTPTPQAYPPQQIATQQPVPPVQQPVAPAPQATPGDVPRA